MPPSAPSKPAFGVIGTRLMCRFFYGSEKENRGPVVGASKSWQVVQSDSPGMSLFGSMVTLKELYQAFSALGSSTAGVKPTPPMT